MEFAWRPYGDTAGSSVERYSCVRRTAVAAGQDVATAKLERYWQPLRARLTACQHEQRGDRHTGDTVVARPRSVQVLRVPRSEGYAERNRAPRHPHI
jgi:hypothetical protein